MRHRCKAVRLATGFAVALLATCDDAPQSNVTFRLDDVWSFARGAMNSGPLPVDIRGVPYGEIGDALNDTVIDAMTQAITWTADPRFSAGAKNVPPSSFRVVVTLNGIGGLGSRDQCLGKSLGGGPLADGRVRAVATFCHGEDVLANVRGEVARTDGPSDPRFFRLVRQISRDMFIPSHDP